MASAGVNCLDALELACGQGLELLVGKQAPVEGHLDVVPVTRRVGVSFKYHQQHNAGEAQYVVLQRI